MIDHNKYDERYQSSKSDIDKIEKKSDEGYQIDRIDENKSDEKDHIVEK